MSQLQWDINPNALYTKAAIQEKIPIKVDHFLERIRPVKRFRTMYWGRDIIRAIEAMEVGERSQAERAGGVNLVHPFVSKRRTSCQRIKKEEVV